MSFSPKGACWLIVHSSVVTRLIVGLIISTLGTQLDIYVSSILVTLRHWTDLSAVGWQQLLLSGIDSQLRYFYGEKLMAGALYYKKHSVVFVIDIYVVIMRFITVKNKSIKWPQPMHTCLLTSSLLLLYFQLMITSLANTKRLITNMIFLILSTITGNTHAQMCTWPSCCSRNKLTVHYLKTRRSSVKLL